MARLPLTSTISAELNLGEKKLEITMIQLTPCYKKTILGSKQPVSGIIFFCRFSLRLSENHHSRVKFIAKFGPTASNFGYEIFIIFWVKIRVLL